MLFNYINRNIISLNRTLVSHIIRAHSTSNMTTTTTTTDGDCSEADLDKGPGLMKILENNPKRLRRIKFLQKLFDKHGYELRIAGGAVRDILKGREPLDIDFATTALPDQSEEILKKHEDLMRIILTDSGKKHGTVSVKFKEKELDFKRIKLSPDAVKTNQPDEPKYDNEPQYEITTLRIDKFTDGRHADVEFINDWRVDAERRDLTINAMFLTLDKGEIVDYFGGEQDLKNGIVRFVGDANLRIQEDYLRILRYFRFWSRYGRGSQPDEDTMNKLRANMEGLDRISGERIWVELKKILSHLPCDEVMELMLRLRVLNHFGLADDELEDYDSFAKDAIDKIKVIQEHIKNYSTNILEPKLRENPTDQEKKRLSQLKELMPVMIFATVVRTNELCEKARLRIKLSNLERDLVLYFIEKRSDTLSVNPLKEYKYELAVCHDQDKPQVLQKLRAFMISEGQFSLIDELESWTIPQFPKLGSKVEKAFKENNIPKKYYKLMRVVIEDLKSDWGLSDYTLSEAQLNDLMREKVRDLASRLGTE